MTTSTQVSPTMRTPEPPSSTLPAWRRPLAVVAHPDDESFGLGAVLASFVAQGASPRVLCFTHGEASTLRNGIDGDLREVRAGELSAAARALGLGGADLLDEPDGALSAIDPQYLADAVAAAARAHRTDGLLVFDRSGVSEHPDHIAATTAAVRAAQVLGLDVLAWTLPLDVASRLNTELGTSFAGRPTGEIDLRVRVERDRQLQAIAAHPSQAVPTSALWRRLALLGESEYLTWLHHHGNQTH